MQFARLKPARGGKGNPLSTYVVFGIKFQEANGWYQVDDDVAAYLAEVPARDTDPDGPKAFDVCPTQDEAQRIDDRERERTRRNAASNAQAVVRVTQTSDTRARRGGASTPGGAPALKRGEGYDPNEHLDEDDFPEDSAGLKGLDKVRPADVVHQGGTGGTITSGQEFEHEKAEGRTSGAHPVGDQVSAGDGPRLTSANDGHGVDTGKPSEASKVEAKPGRDVKGAADKAKSDAKPDQGK